MKPNPRVDFVDTEIQLVHAERWLYLWGSIHAYYWESTFLSYIKITAKSHFFSITPQIYFDLFLRSYLLSIAASVMLSSISLRNISGLRRLFLGALMCGFACSASLSAKCNRSPCTASDMFRSWPEVAHASRSTSKMANYTRITSTENTESEPWKFPTWIPNNYKPAGYTPSGYSGTLTGGPSARSSQIPSRANNSSENGPDSCWFLV